MTCVTLLGGKGVSRAGRNVTADPVTLGVGKGRGGRKVIVTGLCVSINKWRGVSEKGVGKVDCGRIGNLGVMHPHCIACAIIFHCFALAGQGHTEDLTKSSDSKKILGRKTLEKSAASSAGATGRARASSKAETIVTTRASGSMGATGRAGAAIMGVKPCSAGHDW